MLENQVNPPRKNKKRKTFDDKADQRCRMILKTKDKTSSFELCSNMPTAFAQLLELKIKSYIKKYQGKTNWRIAYVR